MSGIINCGLIGLGHRGSKYASTLMSGAVPARLVAVARQDTLAPSPVLTSVLRFRDYRELLASPVVDVVVAAVPPSLHEELCIHALEARKPLLLEKPVATSAAGARRILAAAESAGARIMVAQTMRFDPVVAALRQHIGEVGAVTMLTVSQRFKKSEAHWANAGQSGAVLVVGVHGFDLVQWLLGRQITHVACSVRNVLTLDSPDTFAAICRLEDGGLAAVDGSRASGGRLERCDVVGAKAHLRAELTARRLLLTEGRNESEILVNSMDTEIVACLRSFITSISRDVGFEVSIEDAVSAVEVAEACVKASQGEGLQLVDRTGA